MSPGHAERLPSVSATAVVAVSDPGLLDEVRRVAAAADCRIDERTAPLGRRAWTGAGVIVLDARSAAECALERLPRRPGIVLVTGADPDLAQWQAATGVGAEQVISLPDRAAELVTAMAARPPGAGGGTVVAVVGGRGGAGASTFAAALARTADRGGGRATLLVDCDAGGGGIDLLLGIEDRPGLRWPGLVVEDGRVSSVALHHALPVVGERLAVLACGRGADAPELSSAAVQAVLDAGREAGDLVVCDVARDRSAATTTVLQTADLVVVVVPAELRAVAAAESVVAHLHEHNANQRLIVRGPAPGGLRATDVADALGVPVLTQLRPEPRLAVQLERGGLRLRRRGPLCQAAAAVLEHVATEPARWVA